MKLDQFDNQAFDRGRPRWVEAFWLMLGGLLVESWLPGSGWRAGLLRAFGARVGRGCVLKPRLRIKFPWRLSVGDHSWLGEGVWIDNLAPVDIGSHSVVSQGAYLCTGSHRWDRSGFDLETRPIQVGDQAWVAARASLAPGTRVGEGAVVGFGAVVSGEIEAWTVVDAGGRVTPRPREEAA